MSNGYYKEVKVSDDVWSCVEVEVTQQHKDTYGVGGDIRVRTCDGSDLPHNVWLTVAESKKLRKALKRAEKFLES